jgi:hypothetical protein
MGGARRSRRPWVAALAFTLLAILAALALHLLEQRQRRAELEQQIQSQQRLIDELRRTLQDREGAGPASPPAGRRRIRARGRPVGDFYSPEERERMFGTGERQRPPHGR